MQRNTLLNLALLLIIGALLLLVVFEPGIEEPPAPPTLMQLDRAVIQQIAIQRDGQQDVSLSRDEQGEWWMTQPIRHRADTLRIDSLLRITSTTSLTSFAAETSRLASYQLDKPRVTLTLNGTTRIAFGGSTPLDQRRYVLLDDRVHLISDTLYYHLIGSYPTFLRKQLLADGVRIESLHLPGLNVSWESDKWQLDPAPETFSADQVTRLVGGWKLASALEIKPYDGKPGEALSLRLAGEEAPYTLLLTARDPDLVLARPELGIQYHLDAGSAAQLLQLPALEERAEESGDEESEQQPPVTER